METPIYQSISPATRRPSTHRNHCSGAGSSASRTTRAEAICLSKYPWMHPVGVVNDQKKWRFPEMGVPPNHPFLDGILPYEPSILGVPPFVATPTSIELIIEMSCCCQYLMMKKMKSYVYQSSDGTNYHSVFICYYRYVLIMIKI